MRKLIAFNHVTLDGYFVSGNGDFSWAKDGSDDPEYGAFVAENASSGGELIFGRKTYDLMASYWPTPMADQHDPVVAAGMNSMPKIVFSHTMKKASWNNTEVINGGIVESIQKMKNKPGPGLCILGSGSLIAQLALEDVIDEYQMVLNPLALGKGRSMFDGMKELLALKLLKSRVFKNGKIFLSYGK